MESRPILKRLDIKNLRDWVPPEKRTHFDLAEAWDKVGNYYCASLVSRRSCPIECVKCRAKIETIFEKANQANTPMGWIVALCRDQAAVMNEQMAEERKEKRESSISETLFGREDKNPFTAFLEANT